MTTTYTTRAAFRLGPGPTWSWVRWTHAHGNRHAAILEKAAELGAVAWNFDQADHFPTDRYPWATR